MRILPDGYTQLEYIQSSGTQYVNTGVPHNSSKKITLKVKLAYTTVSPANQIMGFTGNGGCGIGLAKAAWWETSALGSAAANTIYDIEYTANGSSVSRTVNGTTVTATRTSYSFSTNLLLFAAYETVNSSLVTYYCSCKMYNALVYVDDILVRNYVPCKTSNGEVGLYDLVNDVFYGNAGTGTFIAGPEFSYNEIEYIESSGTQYVNTGLSLPTGFKSVMDFTITKSVGTIQVPIGSHDPAEPYNRNYFGIDANLASWNVGFLGVTSFGKPAVNVDYLIDWCNIQGAISCTINGVPQTFNTSGATSATRSALSIYLFAIHNASVDCYCYMRMRGCKIYKDSGGNNLLRDYIPVVGTDNIAGLWDKVEKVFYGNSGSGAFIAGPKKLEVLTEWIDAVCIEGTGTQYIDTLFKPNQNTRVVADIETTTAQAGKAAFGSRIALQNTAFVLWYGGTAGTIQTNYGNDVQTLQLESSVGRFVFDMNKNVTTFGAHTIINSAATFQSEFPMYLFAMNQNGQVDSRILSGKLYSCKIYDNGTLIRDYVPCVTMDGRAGLRDKLTNCFYENKGTGTFTAVTIVAPETPTSLIAPYADFANAVLMWLPAKDAAAYKVTRNGVLADIVEQPFYYDHNLEPKTTYTYSVTAFNEGGDSEPAVLNVQTTQFELVTDRTAEDVQAVLTAITTGQIPGNWLGGMKGAYNAVDLNRVESAAQYIAERYRLAGISPKVETKEWRPDEFMDKSESIRYLNNIKILRSQLPMPANVPAVPQDLQKFTFEEANNIEKILVLLDLIITNIIAAWYFSGEVYCGEVG